MSLSIAGNVYGFYFSKNLITFKWGLDSTIVVLDDRIAGLKHNLNTCRKENQRANLRKTKEKGH